MFHSNGGFKGEIIYTYMMDFSIAMYDYTEG